MKRDPAVNFGASSFVSNAKVMILEGSYSTKLQHISVKFRSSELDQLVTSIYFLPSYYRTAEP